MNTIRRALLIAEKPSVMNDIQNAYNKIKNTYPFQIDFGCCAGHLIGLCDPEEYTELWGKPWSKDVLPMIPVTWKKKIINSKFFSQLKAQWQSGNYDAIINAGDAGREGQAIQYLVYEALGVNVPIFRYWADDTTEKTIIKTLNNLVPDSKYKGLTEASILRMYFDWLVGMNFSRSSSLSLQRATRIGRVLSPTLALVCQREDEIRSFVPLDYYELVYNFKSSSGSLYSGTLINPNATDSSPSKYAFFNKAELENINSFINTIKEGTITEVKEEDKIYRAPTLFNLSDLQKECSKRFGLTPAKTLDIAQSLYEKHFLSYPRTESKCLTTEQAKEMPGLISLVGKINMFSQFANGILGNQELINKALSSKKYVDNKKVSDHPALTPTEVIPDMDSLSKEEKAVYVLVICRFLSIFMPDNIMTQTSAITTLSKDKNNYYFRSAGTVEKQVGWKAIINAFFPKKSTKVPDILPSLTVNDNVAVFDGEIKDKQTTPPKRYDDASIISAMETAGKQVDDEELEKILMEAAGLGTPATRAEILEKLFKYDYLERRSKTIYPTEQGMEYVNILKGRTILSPELTAIWEKKLKEVENGELSYNEFYSQMLDYIKSETTSLLTLNPVGPYKKVIGTCPKCKENFYALSNFYACEGYFKKTCDFGLPLEYGKRKLTVTDVKALINGEMTKPKEFTWKNGTKSTTALILQDFKLAFPTAEMQREYVGKCPLCGGRVIAGSKGYYCENWSTKNEQGNSSCNFTVFGKIGETKVSSKQMGEILSFGETKKEVTVKWKSGKSLPGKLCIQMYKEGKYGITVKPYEKKALCQCPYCKIGTFYEDRSRYHCDNTPSNGGSCLASVPKTYLEYSISPDDAVKLLNGEHLNNVMLKSKTKNTLYPANLYTEIDEEKGLIIKQQFVNNWKKQGK